MSRYDGRLPPPPLRRVLIMRTEIGASYGYDWHSIGGYGTIRVSTIYHWQRTDLVFWCMFASTALSEKCWARRIQSKYTANTFIMKVKGFVVAFDRTNHHHHHHHHQQRRLEKIRCLCCCTPPLEKIDDLLSTGFGWVGQRVLSVSTRLVVLKCENTIAIGSLFFYVFTYWIFKILLSHRPSPFLTWRNLKD